MCIVRCNHISYRLEPFLDLSLPLTFTGTAKTNGTYSNTKKKDGVLTTKHQQKKLRKQQKQKVCTYIVYKCFRSINIKDEFQLVNLRTLMKMQMMKKFPRPKKLFHQRKITSTEKSHFLMKMMKTKLVIWVKYNDHYVIW